MSKKEFVHNLSTDDLVLLIDKRSSELLTKLNDTRLGFEHYLKTQKYVSVNGEVCLKDVEIILEILSHACSEKKHLGSLRKLLRMLKDCNKFLYDDLPSVIGKCLIQKQDINIVMFIANYICVLKNILKHFAVAEIGVTFLTVQNFINRLKELKVRNIEVALEQFQGLKALVDKYDEPIGTSDDEEDRVENFRKLSVVPKDNDIVNCEIVNLPINIIDAPYKSVTHYLSVHYRLMREDMLRTFRDCINLCMNSDQGSVFKTGCNLYQGVNVVYPPEYTVKGIQYKLQIFTTKKINLLPGSLVCLTADSFHSAIFASVKKVKSSKGRSENCILTILLEDDLMLDKLNPKYQYLMIETSAYFECYRHVLSAIREFTENSFPLADIIVYLNYEEAEPEYLSNMQYCLHEKCPGDVLDHDSHSCKIFDPHDKSAWPTAEELQLDDQQCEAVRIALTKKVAIIQGPPGTGKTFIGVKIVNYLLNNVQRSPIIISCLTNHALDQFLERILLYTNKVVRLGSQSKSELLEPYVMTGVMNDFHTSKELEDICDEINDNLYFIDICEHKFLDDRALEKIINPVHKREFKILCRTDSKCLSKNIYEWLCITCFNDPYEEYKKRIDRISVNSAIPTHCKYETSDDLWSLDLNTRYVLFSKWKEDYISLCKTSVTKAVENYQKTFFHCQQPYILDKTKRESLKQADIIGVTTTGASKYKDLLKFAEPTIMIVEEAAEVLESHIIASLVPSIQHLILIGDHKQLRPIPANHELSEKHNLKISMFERLFRNSAPSATLVTQHRMKPCIAELLVPEIYDELRSAENVYKYEEIKGVKSSVFFLNHSEPENINSSSVSASNEFEARVIVSLAQYLCAQSYSADQITILATYAAQVVLIQQYLNEVNLDMCPTTVDNYQGEENDIILISFVRSNSGFIGFLKEKNRVCVALSRAKKGMFCIGNFKLFSRKSELWNSMVTKLETKNMVGEKLPVQCHQHKTVSEVKTADDIVAFLKSGCSEKCDFELSCGHKCNRSCHLDDSDHLRYFCQMACTKFIDESRICPRLCYQPCKRVKKRAVELPCGHYSRSIDSLRCEEEVQRCLPCSHLDTLPCYVDVSRPQMPKISICKTFLWACKRCPLL
ncbi:NFX1-type zinc finger-containing protein 1-like [Stegodyphus dumicola]|uniref:NFX1-type zinc finger-containing protein 1-like n=1 Tax=Stegodyphus dumicola TaxID=202533 RepID=UPI0015AE47E2|nr:NFX1-type zinc finger-containing protein 1-like [Stegodyphus dumicola]